MSVMFDIASLASLSSGRHAAHDFTPLDDRQDLNTAFFVDEEEEEEEDNYNDNASVGTLWSVTSSDFEHFFEPPRFRPILPRLQLPPTRPASSPSLHPADLSLSDIDNNLHVFSTSSTESSAPLMGERRYSADDILTSAATAALAAAAAAHSQGERSKPSSWEAEALLGLSGQVLRNRILVLMHDEAQVSVAQHHPHQAPSPLRALADAAQSLDNLAGTDLVGVQAEMSSPSVVAVSHVFPSPSVVSSVAAVGSSSRQRQPQSRSLSGKQRLLAPTKTAAPTRTTAATAATGRRATTTTRRAAVAGAGAVEQGRVRESGAGRGAEAVQKHLQRMQEARLAKAKVVRL